MSLSLPGLAVWALLLLLGRFAGSPLLVGFFASLPFASTAFATLDSLGGSSPLIYTLFILALFGVIAARRNLLGELGTAFANFKPAWLAVALGVYALAGAYILPRLFAGETYAFVPVDGAVKEVPLGPVSGNITQPAYFLLGVLLFIALCMVLPRADNLQKLTRAFFAFVIALVLTGWIDLGAKLTGMGDLLLPIRTASYALLTEAEQSGFWRIVGACSEASTFSTYGLAALAFSFTYWRQSDSRGAALLTVLLLALLLLSTSSTAYVGLGALSFFALAAIGWGALRNRMKTADIVLVTAALLILAITLGVYLYDSTFFDPFVDLINTMVFDKANSDSGQERAYWNMKSLQNFSDTFWLGIGMGSSRSSSWAVSTISQLGLIGSALIGAMVLLIARGMSGIRPLEGEKPIFALCAGARACGLTSLLSASIAGSSADPGVLFFASLATVLACRHHVLARRGALAQAEGRAMPAHFAGRPA